MDSATMRHTDKLVVVLLYAAAAAITCAVASSSHNVDTFRFPAFDNTTLDEFIAVSNAGVLRPAGLLFEQDQVFTEFNRSEGFLLLGRMVAIWRARGGSNGGFDLREASFNSTFTLAGPTPVAFVVLKDTIELNNSIGLRGPANASLFGQPDGRASDGGLAAVEAGLVRSYYHPDDSGGAGFGLNVTVTPNGTAPSRTVWIEYDAAAHRLSVYVAAGGQPKPAKAILDAGQIFLADRRTTEMAHVGFFAGTIRDVVDSVSGWELTVDALGGGNRNKEPSSVMMLLAVLLCLAATAAM